MVTTEHCQQIASKVSDSLKIKFDFVCYDSYDDYYSFQKTQYRHWEDTKDPTIKKLSEPNDIQSNNPVYFEYKFKEEDMHFGTVLWMVKNGYTRV